MSDACKHRSGRKTPPSYSFPSLGSRERASRHALVLPGPGPTKGTEDGRSEEHTSELQSLMRISYAVFCLKKKKEISDTHKQNKQKIHDKSRLSFIKLVTQ